MDYNENFKLITGVVNEYFPNSMKWFELYQIAREGISDTSKRVADAFIEFLSDDVSDENRLKTLVGKATDSGAITLYEKYKNDFPLKTVIKRNPSHVLEFCVKCATLGHKEACQGIKDAIGYVKFKIEH